MGHHLKLPAGRPGKLPRLWVKFGCHDCRDSFKHPLVGHKMPQPTLRSILTCFSGNCLAVPLVCWRSLTA